MKLWLQGLASLYWLGADVIIGDMFAQVNAKRLFWLPALLVVLLAPLVAGGPAVAAPQFQNTPFPTPTPGDDGRILYTVQPGDTCFFIAAVSEITLDELRSLNNIGTDCVLQVGQVILLGLAGPAQPTEGPEATAAPSEATPSPTPGISTGSICVLLYNDLNGDGIRQATEVGLGGGAVSVTERNGLFSGNEETVDSPADLPVPACFDEIPAGNYNITVAIPDDYNPTTAINLGLELQPGDTTQINFGAQQSGAAIAAQAPPEEGGRSPLLGILGIGLLVLGAGLGLYSIRLARGG